MSNTEENMKTLSDYPEISFINNLTMQQLQSQMLQRFYEKRQELTGQQIKLGEADDRRILLNTAAYFIYQAFMQTDTAGKMGLLKYAVGDYLDNLAAGKGIYRLQPRGSTVTLRWSIVEAREAATSVPKGSRATAGDGVYFETVEYAEIPSGKTYVDVEAKCSETGTKTNGYLIGSIDRMESPVAYIDSVANVTMSQNGRDLENDEDLRIRVYLAPESYTSGGSYGAYEYYVREFDSSIEDVFISSPQPRIVEVRSILQGGELPDEEYIKNLKDYLSQDNIKMLTDEISVKAPDTVEYKVSLKYYVSRADMKRENLIKERIEEAVDGYILWQKTKIGRDINPDELIRRVREAGAKRVELSYPVFQAIGKTAVAKLRDKIVTYGGVEDD